MRIAPAEFLSYTCPEPNSGCLLWMGPIVYDTKHGPRGQVIKKKERRYAARVAYELFKGNIPPKHVIRHKCDVPLCVNPEHLLTGTQLDNIADRVERKRTVALTGEDHAHSILTDKQVRLIREKRATGKSWAKLAAEFDVSIYCIRYAVQWGWKHV